MIADLAENDGVPADEQELPPRRAGTPSVAPTSDLVGTADTKPEDGARLPPIDSTSTEPRDGDMSDDDTRASESPDSRTASKRRPRDDKQPSKVMSPEEFQREQARAKRMKVAKQVDKMKRAMEKNRQREEAQQEHMLAMRRRMKQQEQERQQQLEREEVLRYLRERQARKRDAELAVQREAREAATAARQEALRKEKEARAAEMRERERERAQQLELKRREHERQMAERQEEQQRRLDGIYQQNEALLEDRAAELAARMATADEQRRKLEAQRDAELAHRKAENARKQAENEEKRRKAEERQAARVGRYVERAKHADEVRTRREKERANSLELRRLQEQDEAERREKLRRDVAARELEKQEKLRQRMDDEERRRQEVAAAKEHEAKLRLAEKEIEVEDRIASVHRTQRQLEQERAEADERYQAKMHRIARMRADMHTMDEERKKLQAEALRARPPPGAFAQPTPGPGEYAVADAEHKLRTGPSVKMGAAPPKVRHVVVETPGPGEYGNPTHAIRANKGAKLPPRVGGLAGSSSTATSPARSHSAMSSRLPSIRRERGPARAATSMGANARGGGSSPTLQRPAELRDEDFDTDEEFEAA